MDAARIDGWYSELDETKNSQVGGAKIVKFLMGSTLPKDILRTIWELGDSDKRGYVDRAQFTRMIRLVSICQRPGFEAPPTMDKYYASVNDLIPLPSLDEDHVTHAGKQMEMSHVIDAEQVPPALATPLTAVVQLFKSIDDPSPIDENADDDDFDDFVTPDQPAATSAAAAAAAIATHADEDDFDDFVTSDQPASAEPLSNAISMELPAANSMGGMHMPVIVGMSAFDSFGDLENAPVVSLPPMSMIAPTNVLNKAEDGEDDDFGEFGDHDSEKISNSTSAAAPALALAFAAAAADDFGDFDSPAVAKSITQVPTLSQSVGKGYTNDEDDFGNFGSADVDLKIAVPSSILAVNLKPLGEAAGAAADDNDFGDFGDFEELPTPTQHTAPAVSSAASIRNIDTESRPSLVSSQTSNDNTDDFGDFGGFDEDLTTAAAATTTADSEASLSIGVAFAPPSPKSAPPPLPATLPSPRHSWSSPPPLPQISPRNSFGGVPGLGPSPMASPAASPRNSINMSSPFDVLHSSASPRNSFNLSSPNNSNNAVASIFDGNAASSPISSSPGTAADGTDRPMNVSELEQLTLGLKEKNRYEAGYATAAQMAYRRRMQVLLAEKNKAIEDDDLETAIEIKKATNMITGLLASVEEEKKWISVLRESDGEALAEMVELVETAFSRTLGKGCKCLFILRSPLPDLADEMRFLYLSKRCIRLIITVYTTHAPLLPAWSKMAEVITKMLQKALINQIQAFKELCAADQAEVKSSQRMNVFVSGIIAIAETGLHIAASLLNTLSITEEAEILEAAAYSVLNEVQQLWGSRSDLLDLQDQGRVLKESGIDVPLDATIIYCNLTLRPLGVLSTAGEIVPLPGHGKKVTKIVIVDTPRGDAHYMANAVQFYKRNISPNLPEIDCPFPGFI